MISGFLLFSGGIKRDQCINNVKYSKIVLIEVAMVTEDMEPFTFFTEPLSYLK